MTLAQETSLKLSNFSSGLRKAGAGIAAAAQMAGASLPSLGVAAVGTAAFGASAQKADSAVMLSAGSFPGQNYIDAAAPYVNNGSVVAIRITDPVTGEPNYASAYKIGPDQYVTAAHVLSKSSGLADASSISILPGANYYTPMLEASVSSYRIHPSFVLGSSFGTGSQIDLAVITTSTAVVGTSIQFAAQAPANGATIDHIGFGRPQLEYQGAVALDGFARMFQGRALTPTSSYNNDFFGASTSLGVASNIVGNGSVDDSGGLVAYQGLGIGIMISSSAGRTTWADMTNPAVQNFLNVPELSTVTFTLVTAGAFSLRRNRKKSDPLSPRSPSRQ